MTDEVPTWCGRPGPEWTAITNLNPPSKWADLADRISTVEYAITCHRERLLYVLDMVQDRLPVAAENDDLWWECEALRRSVDRLPGDVEAIDDLLAELFSKFGPRVDNSAGTDFVKWREGPWYTLAARTDDDG